MNKLTTSKIIPFFPDDNRFIHFVARKHGLFFQNDDDIESARFHALHNAMRMVNSGKEYESEAHLNSLMEVNARHAIHSMLDRKRAKKRSLEIRTEAEFFVEGNDESYSILERSSEDDYYDERAEIVEEFMHIIRDNENAEGVMMFEMHMVGYTDIEIAKKLGITPQAVSSRRQRTKTKLKNYYEVNTWTYSTNVRKIRKRVRNKSVASNKAKSDSHGEALSYLGLA